MPAAPSTTRRSPSRGLRRIRGRIAWHRRLLAAGLAAAAAFTAVQTLRPDDDSETVVVLVAARDLPAGRTLGADDVERAEYRADTAPTAALPVDPPPTERILAAPLRAGTPLTDRALVGPGLLDSLPQGTIAAPVRLDEFGLLPLLRVGDRVDVLAAAPGSTPFRGAGESSFGGPGAGPDETSADISDDEDDEGAAEDDEGVAGQESPPLRGSDEAPGPTGGDSGFPTARLLVRSARVLALPAAGPGDAPRAPSPGDLPVGRRTADATETGPPAEASTGLANGVVLLAVDRAEANELAGVPNDARLSLVLNGTGEGRR